MLGLPGPAVEGKSHDAHGLEASAHVNAGLGLLALAWHLGSAPLGVLGFFVLVSVGRTLRVGRAARRLQDEGVGVTVPASAPGQEEDAAVRVEAVPRIVAMLKENRTPPPARAVLAAEAVAVINQLRARPPGAVAVAVLLAVYLTAWGLALVPGWPMIARHHTRRRVPVNRDWAHPRAIYPTPEHDQTEPTPGQ